jgi:hypothetical protein
MGYIQRFLAGALRTKERAGGGMIIPEYIPNEDLLLEEIPQRGAPWHEIALFSLTFGGYCKAGSFNRCTLVAYTRECKTLSEMRACLFFEQRRCVLERKRPDPAAMEFIYCLLDGMRNRILAGDRA